MLPDIQKGDRVRITIRTRKDQHLPPSPNSPFQDQICFAYVNWVEVRITPGSREKYIYFGYSPDQGCGWGCGIAYDTEKTRRWGMIEVVSLGQLIRPKSGTYERTPNLVGDPAYDLMRDPHPRFRDR